MARKMTLIVVTDAACWLPIILLGLLSLAGVIIPPQVSSEGGKGAEGERYHSAKSEYTRKEKWVIMMKWIKVKEEMDEGKREKYKV